MVFEQIEKVKREYTDKYVVVDGQRAELARFKDLVGQVKTVNMSGRALVEFLEYHLNIGWFDIDLDYLKVVDKPSPKPIEEKKPVAKKPAAKKPAAASEKKLSPLEMARQGDGGGNKKQSTSDVLAALRAGKSGGAAAAQGAEAKAAESKAKGPVAAKAGSTKVDRSKVSVADMLAAARGGAAPAADPAQGEAETKTETPAPDTQATGAEVTADANLGQAR